MGLTGDNIDTIIRMFGNNIHGTIITLSNNPEDTHFVNRRGNRQFDPYELHMQNEGSHQFCQTHALILALEDEPSIGKRIQNVVSKGGHNMSKGDHNDLKEDAYDGLLDFWTRHLVNIINAVLSVKGPTGLIEQFNIQIDNQRKEDKTLVRNVMKTIQPLQDMLLTNNIEGIKNHIIKIMSDIWSRSYWIYDV